MSQTQIERVEVGELACWRVHVGDAELLVAQQGLQTRSPWQPGRHG